MELDSELAALDVAHRHRHPVVRCGGDLHTGRNRPLVEAKRVIADGLERTRDTGEQRAPVVGCPRHASVHRHRRSDNPRSVGVPEPLMAEADAQQRDSGISNDFSADSEIVRSLGRPRAGRHQHRNHAVAGNQFPPPPLGVLDDERLACRQLPDQLRQVECERVPVIDNKHLH